LQRLFVLEMLRSSNFNKLLSAARECNFLVKRSQMIWTADNTASLRVRSLGVMLEVWHSISRLCASTLVTHHSFWI
jgi:hypothetical protein